MQMRCFLRAEAAGSAPLSVASLVALNSEIHPEKFQGLVVHSSQHCLVVDGAAVRRQRYCWHEPYGLMPKQQLGAQLHVTTCKIVQSNPAGRVVTVASAVNWSPLEPDPLLGDRQVLYGASAEFGISGGMALRWLNMLPSCMLILCVGAPSGWMHLLPQGECATCLASCQRKRDLVAESGEAA